MQDIISKYTGTSPRKVDFDHDAATRNGALVEDKVGDRESVILNAN